MRVCAAMAIVVLGTSVAAQGTKTFDAVSVKRNTGNGAGLPQAVVVTSQRLSAPFVTLREAIRVAFGVYDNQVVGGPGWLDTDRFELNATIPTGTSIDGVREMMRRMLADRFGLVTHQETRDLPVYTLTSAGQLGPRMRLSSPTCAPLTGPPGIPTPPPPPPPPAGAGATTILGMPPGSKCGSLAMRGHISARELAVETLVWTLMRELGRLVVDRTGLTGRYDLDLTFLPDSGPMTINGQPISADAPSLTTAVREQLGLRLESGRAPVDVVVIDRVNPPTEN